MKYRFVVDEWTAEQWSSLVSTFSDMSIYQTWHYAALHSRGPFRSVSRTALLCEDSVEIIAAFRIKNIPLAHIGVAEADWGPLWCSENLVKNDLALHFFLESIRGEFCDKRGLKMRLKPRSTMSAEKDARLVQILQDQRFFKNSKVRPYHTVILDLSYSLESLRANLHQKWRNQLNVSEKAGLTVDFGNNLEHFDRFYTIYKKMWVQKKFPTGVRLPIIRELQKNLPADERFFIAIAQDGTKDIGATVCATLGDTVHYFLGATSPDARQDSRPGYLLQWMNIAKAKERGFRWYDTGGYDDVKSPDIARFKTRMNGSVVIYPGQFEAVPNQSPSKLYEVAEISYRKLRRLLTGK